MEKTKIIKIILTIIFATVLTGGFIKIFSIIFQESLSQAFILINLPLLIGALLIKDKEFRRDGLGFLFTNLFLLIGFFLLIFSSEYNKGYSTWAYIIVLNIGAFMFSYRLAMLFEKVGDALLNKTKNESSQIP